MQKSLFGAVFALGAVVLVGFSQPTAAHGEKEVDTRDAGHEPLDVPRRLVMPEMDSAKGKSAFIEKACITCHGLNGVGGMDAPQIDAHAMAPVMNAYEFAARMWNHAQGMAALQIEALGEQIELTGTEMAHIAAFLHDDDMQHTLTQADIPARVRTLMHHAHEDQEEGHADEPRHDTMPHGHEAPTHMHQ